MKKLTIWSILILFTACDTDNDLKIDSEIISANDSPSMFRRSNSYPENTANIYDCVGKLQNEICGTYLLQNNLPGTTAVTLLKIESIANLNSEFQTLLPATYVSPTGPEIDDILNGQTTIANVISNSTMSIKGKTSLSEFVTTLMYYRDQKMEYDSIYQFIIGYEKTVIGNIVYTANDKKIILSTTSISRYAFYFASKRKKRKPKDEDWDISWGHIVAAIEGSDESSASAIVKASVCNILTNE